MKKIIFLFTFHVSLFTFHVNSQWLQQTSGVTTSLLDCDFINQNTGWACGDNGVILKTTNGGVNWLQQNTGVFKRLEGIDAVDANIVYSVGWWQTILKSTNGGTSWLIIRNGPNSGPSFNKAYFLNANTGWLLRDGSNGGYILRTTNGGITFDSTNVIFSYMWDIYFKDAQTGVLCGNGALIMRSTDGGVAWTQIPLPLLGGGMPNLYRISFVGDWGWVIGEGGPVNGGRLVWRTTNFGSNWDSIARVPYPSNELNYSVFFSSLNTGYAGGTNGYLFKSTNGGINWIQQVITGGGFRRDFYFTTDSMGWVVGGGGQIFKTTNGGTYVGISGNKNEIPLDFELLQNFPNPFNPITTIKFKIAIYGNIHLSVFDLLGREISVLVNKYLMPGEYSIIFDGSKFSSGTYLYQLKSSDFIINKRMVLTK